MNFRLSLAAAVLTLTALPVSASAQDQPWLQDRRYTEGIGIRTGDVELHPGVAAEFGYDSNYFRRSDKNGEGPVGSLRLRITPSFSLSTLSRQRLEATPDAPPPDFEFRAGIAATYDEFFPVSGPEEGQDLMSEQRNIGGTLDLQLAILPKRPWSGVLEAEVGRSIAPSDLGLTEASFNRIHAGAGGELIWTPGGGLLDWRLGYHFGGTFFESADFQNLTNLQHEARTRGRWRFLPRTALMYDARFGFIGYPEGTGKTSSHPLRTQLGVNGLITNSFGVLAMAGWGASFYTPTGQNDFDSVIGQLELKWFLTPNPSTDPAAATLTLSSLAAGFVRDFHDSYIGTYFEQDRGYLKLTYFFGGRFLLVVDGGVGPIVYPDIPATDDLSGHSAFSDIRVDASAFGEYRFADSFGINTTVRYGTNISDTSFTNAAGEANSLQWQQFEAFLGVRWFM
ncbi:MAG: hypothetical protein IT372_28225 [Polyangiaceae bacterium]|nr:hypothetical protein [Polyangiaceae bacterium]